MSPTTTVRRKKRKDEIKVAIGPFRNPADYKACEDIQREALHSQDIDVIPISMLQQANRVGGILLAAYSGLGDMVGFTFSILGTLDGKPVQNCSMLAVRAAYRNFDVGFKLLVALRDEARKRKITRIAASFDPMQPLHAYFFLGKMGFRADVYEENLYGETTSQFDRGLPTDRLTAVWDLEDAGTAKLLDTGPARHDLRKELKRTPAINQLTETAPGLYASSPAKTDCSAELFLFEIPYNLPEIKNRDLGAAMEWQRTLRQVFRAYFKKGYKVADFWTTEQDGHLRACHVLKK
jgi:predicted GNAT superfamily acetyltransferase